MSVLEKLKKRIHQSFPNGKISVLSEDEVHFKVVVVDAGFNGLNKIDQHRKVYAAVGDMMANECHALQIETHEEH